MPIKYIVIEWIHWSWKSTISKELTKILQQNWINSEYIHFPNEKEKLWQHIREVLTDKELYQKREVLWLLYASASNSFHIKTQNDNKIYVLERDSVTTGLVFQKDIPREIRMEIYKFWIQNLVKQGLVIYIDVDKNLAFQRTQQRNEELHKKWEVRANKAKDKFLEDFEKLSNEYKNNLPKQIQKLKIPFRMVTNNDTISNCLKQITSNLQQVELFWKEINHLK